MRSASCLGLTCLLLAGCSGDSQTAAPKSYTVVERKGISDSYDIDVTVQAQDISPSDIEALARQERRNLVRVFVYRPEQTLETEKPAELWEFTEAEGLKQIH